MRRKIKDDDGVEVTPGCVVCFAYGIPPVYVEAEVVDRNGKLILLTPGHSPKESTVAMLRRDFSFYVKQ